MNPGDFITTFFFLAGNACFFELYRHGAKYRYASWYDDRRRPAKGLLNCGDPGAVFMNMIVRLCRNPQKKQPIASGGSFLHRAFSPRRPGIPHCSIIPGKVENSTPEKRGVKGMLPACCLPLWGREGVTLIATAENYRMTLKKRVSTEPVLKKTALPGKDKTRLPGDSIRSRTHQERDLLPWLTWTR